MHPPGTVSCDCLVFGSLHEQHWRYDILELHAELGQHEMMLSRLIDEHRKVQKRVNALKYNIIPSHEATIKYIHDIMEESDRENIFQLQMLRKRSAA